MLEKNDLTAIRQILREEIQESNVLIFNRIDEAIEKNNVLIFNRIDEAIEKNNVVIFNKIDAAIEENNVLIFDEMERYYQMNRNEILELKTKMEELEQYYKIKKLEDNTVTILLRITEEIRSDVNEIKRMMKKCGKCWDIDEKALTTA